jgi:hypothetical protein
MYNDDATIIVKTSEEKSWKCVQLDFPAKRMDIKFLIDTTDQDENMDVQKTVEDLECVLKAMKSNESVSHNFTSERFFSSMIFTPKEIFTSGELTIIRGEQYEHIVTITIPNHPSLIEEIVSVQDALKTLLK